MSFICAMCRRLSGLILVLGLLIPAGSWADVLDVKFSVTSEWLNANRSNERVRVLDVRKETDYAAGHVDGAVSLPIDRLFVNDNDKKLIGPLAQIQKAFSAAGVDDKTLVVVYDAGEFLNAARAFWVFEVYGHARVVVLDGGFAGWTKANLAVNAKAVVPAPRNFVPTVTPNRLATKLTTRLAIDQRNTAIIDARDDTDYRGEKSVAQRFGHIPSATNVPVMDDFEVVNGIKRLRTVDQLKQRYRAIDPGKRVITYCNVGVASAGTYFSLRRIGIDVANYDGSWIEWGNDNALPIVEPAKLPAK